MRHGTRDPREIPPATSQGFDDPRLGKRVVDQHKSLAADRASQTSLRLVAACEGHRRMEAAGLLRSLSTQRHVLLPARARTGGPKRGARRGPRDSTRSLGSPQGAGPQVAALPHRGSSSRKPRGGRRSPEARGCRAAERPSSTRELCKSTSDTPLQRPNPVAAALPCNCSQTRNKPKQPKSLSVVSGIPAEDHLEPIMATSTNMIRIMLLRICCCLCMSTCANGPKHKSVDRLSLS